MSSCSSACASECGSGYGSIASHARKGGTFGEEGEHQPIESDRRLNDVRQILRQRIGQQAVPHHQTRTSSAGCALCLTLRIVESAAGVGRGKGHHRTVRQRSPRNAVQTRYRRANLLAHTTAAETSRGRPAPHADADAFRRCSTRRCRRLQAPATGPIGLCLSAVGRWRAAVAYIIVSVRGPEARCSTPCSVVGSVSQHRAARGTY